MALCTSKWLSDGFGSVIHCGQTAVTVPSVAAASRTSGLVKPETYSSVPCCDSDWTGDQPWPGRRVVAWTTKSSSVGASRQAIVVVPSGPIAMAGSLNSTDGPLRVTGADQAPRGGLLLVTMRVVSVASS